MTDAESEAPDTAVPVVGWRVWRVGGDRTGPELVSPAVPTGWRPRTAMTAECSRGCPQPPAWACGCGIYATTALDLLLPTFAAGGAVLGCVALWGRVVEADRGWRGEHAYPLVVLALRPDRDREAFARALEAGDQYVSRAAARVRRVRLLAARVRSPLIVDDVVLGALGDRYAVPVRALGGAPPPVPDGVVAHRAEVLRDEAARGLASRRLGDGRARRRFDRSVEDLVAAFGQGSDPGTPLTA